MTTPRLLCRVRILPASPRRSPGCCSRASIPLGLPRKFELSTDPEGLHTSRPRRLDSPREWLQPRRDAQAAQLHKHAPQTNGHAMFSKTCSITIVLRRRSSGAVRPPPDTCPIRHADLGGTLRKILLAQLPHVPQRSGTAVCMFSCSMKRGARDDVPVRCHSSCGSATDPGSAAPQTP